MPEWKGSQIQYGFNGKSKAVWLPPDGLSETKMN